MARTTRIEKKSRTNKRPQGTLVWDISSAAFVTSTGRVPRLDNRGFPTKNSADSTVVAYSTQA